MNKPTHLLIPIEDWERPMNFIKSFKKPSEAEKAILSVYEKWLSTSTKLSLDEESIKVVANKAYPDYEELMMIYEAADNDFKREGYIQALKDILR